MSRSVILTNCTVEITLPNELDVLGMDVGKRSHVKLMASEYIDDVVIRSPTLDGKTLTIKRLLLKMLRGDILPVMEDDRVVLFTVTDEVEPQHAVSPAPAAAP